MEPDQLSEDNNNMFDLRVKKMTKTEKAKETPAVRSRKHRVILILGVLLILALLILFILTGVLFNHYNNTEEEITQLKAYRIGSCCPEGWKTIGSKCYYFQNTSDTWERSREECAKNYSVLLTLKDKDELDSVLPFLKGPFYWIGLRRDAQNSSRWLWVDGTPLTFSTLWNESQPTNLNDENCAEIWKSRQSVFDVKCGDKNRSICKAQWRC
ncbi:natural killer cells antigen CD94-like [Rana temporaria]|uniref:natural killer cells antigen CD94-like n=1 Tax=Rana temporaria TaxID=8407 RepID=UPI001AAE074E|nr:natural killer cells antigen CD94-like [Rana temporaria]